MLESVGKMWYNNYIFTKRGIMMNISELNPKKVFEYFALLSSVPHGSGNMKPIADICENFAKEKGFEYTRDAADNIIIKKPGTEGYESSEPLIIQGHLDMVWEKDWQRRCGNVTEKDYDRGSCLFIKSLSELQR